MNKMPKFIYFRQGILPFGELNDRWSVQTKKDDMRLGTIEWDASWRCFVLVPREAAVFEHVCLRDIADFIERETTRRKAKTKQAAAAAPAPPKPEEEQP